MNAEDIRNVTFDKVMRGYRPEEVDAYLDQVAAELERLQTEKADAEKKMYILAEKVDQYRNDEETLKTALLNAQRMGESVIHEARQKAETIIYDATSKASQAREEAVEKVAEEEMLLARLKAEVAHFKGEVLNLYKQHIESLSMIPGAEERKRRRRRPRLKNSPSLPRRKRRRKSLRRRRSLPQPRPNRDRRLRSRSIRTLLLRTN